MMLHPATIMLVLLRILAGLSDQLKYSTIFDIFIILILLFYSKLISLTLQILSLLSSVPFVNFLLLKGQYYLYGQSNYQSFAGTREIIGISLILLDQVVEFIFFLHLSRCNLVKGYSVFYVFVMTLVLGSILNTQIYIRFTMVLLFLSIPMRMILLDGNKLKKGYHNLSGLYLVVSMLFSTLMFIYWYILTYQYLPL
ncbi:hypothetical protein AYR62_02970 [Secundilactobacillus paracollinoides]|nr:hypothetical protein AYR62_02970 [Secundilactobacillus paracollinoides]